MCNGAIFQPKPLPHVPGYGGSSWFLSADVSFPSRIQKGDHKQFLKTCCQAWVTSSPPSPHIAALTLCAWVWWATGSSLVAVCCFVMPLPSVLFISSLILYHSFFLLKCGFCKPGKTIILENNVVSQQGCKLVKPECKLFSNEYCWYVGNNPE